MSDAATMFRIEDSGCNYCFGDARLRVKLAANVNYRFA
jgi:hypothetical protein